MHALKDSSRSDLILHSNRHRHINISNHANGYCRLPGSLLLHLHRFVHCQSLYVNRWNDPWHGNVYRTSNFQLDEHWCRECYGNLQWRQYARHELWYGGQWRVWSMFRSRESVVCVCRSPPHCDRYLMSCDWHGQPPHQLLGNCDGLCFRHRFGTRRLGKLLRHRWHRHFLHATQPIDPTRCLRSTTGYRSNLFMLDQPNAGLGGHVVRLRDLCSSR